MCFFGVRYEAFNAVLFSVDILVVIHVGYALLFYSGCHLSSMERQLMKTNTT